jgi:hypothetical protein
MSVAAPNVGGARASASRDAVEVREHLSQVAWQPGHSVAPGVLIVDAQERIAGPTRGARDQLKRLGVTGDDRLPASLRAPP